MLLATHSLSQPLRGSSRGTLVGYSAAGPPLYSFAGEALQRTSQSLMTVARNGLRQIIEESDSRRIFYFLCVNLVSITLDLPSYCLVIVDHMYYPERTGDCLSCVPLGERGRC